MKSEIESGNLISVRRVEVDFLGIVTWTDDENVAYRYLDSPRDAAYNVVPRSDVTKLADSLEQMEGGMVTFDDALTKQRQIVFSPKASKDSLSSLLRGVSGEKQDAIFKVLLEDNVEKGEENNET